jgi:hypothetical protein
MFQPGVNPLDVLDEKGFTAAGSSMPTGSARNQRPPVPRSIESLGPENDDNDLPPPAAEDETSASDDSSI